jgi:hypothetical protein
MADDKLLLHATLLLEIFDHNFMRQTVSRHAWWLCDRH